MYLEKKEAQLDANKMKLYCRKFNQFTKEFPKLCMRPWKIDIFKKLKNNKNVSLKSEGKWEYNKDTYGQ